MAVNIPIAVPVVVAIAIPIERESYSITLSRVRPIHCICGVFILMFIIYTTIEILHADNESLIFLYSILLVIYCALICCCLACI